MLFINICYQNFPDYIDTMLQFALIVLGFQEMIPKCNVLYPRVFT